MSSAPMSDEDGLRAFIDDPSPGWLIKHSTSCGISAAAFDAYESHLQAHPDQRAGHIIIQSHRPLSNLTAELLGRVHQSPQLFLLRAGEVLWTATHWSISADAMAAAWNEHAPA